MGVMTIMMMITATMMGRKEVTRDNTEKTSGASVLEGEHVCSAFVIQSGRCPILQCEILSHLAAR